MKDNQLEILNNFSNSFESEFYKHAKFLHFKKGTSPFFPDDLLRHFYIVMEGRVKTYQFSFETNKEQTVFIYKRGDMFDAVSLLDNQSHEISYEVIEDCSVLQLPMEKVRYWLENDTSFNKKIFLYLAAQMRYTEELALELTLYDTKDRLAKFLLDNLNEKKRFRYNLLHNLSNSEIAKLIGTVRHVIERTLKQLKEDGIIESSRKNIIIKNFQKLFDKTSKMLLK